MAASAFEGMATFGETLGAGKSRRTATFQRGLIV
jgi:hypothetical protein